MVQVKEKVKMQVPQIVIHVTCHMKTGCANNHSKYEKIGKNYANSLKKIEEEKKEKKPRVC